MKGGWSGKTKASWLDGNCQWDNGSYVAKIKFVNAHCIMLSIFPHFLKPHRFPPSPPPTPSCLSRVQRSSNNNNNSSSSSSSSYLILRGSSWTIWSPEWSHSPQSIFCIFFCGKVIVLPVFFYLGLSTTSPTARPWKGRRWSRMIISTTITESPGRALSASSDHEKHIKIPTKNNLSQRYLFLWIFTWRIADSHRPTEQEF